MKRLANTILFLSLSTLAVQVFGAETNTESFTGLYKISDPTCLSRVRANQSAIDVNGHVLVVGHHQLTFRGSSMVQGHVQIGFPFMEEFTTGEDSSRSKGKLGLQPKYETKSHSSEEYKVKKCYTKSEVILVFPVTTHRCQTVERTENGELLISLEDETRNPLTCRLEKTEDQSSMALVAQALKQKGNDDDLTPALYGVIKNSYQTAKSESEKSEIRRALGILREKFYEVGNSEQRNGPFENLSSSSLPSTK